MYSIRDVSIHIDPYSFASNYMTPDDPSIKEVEATIHNILDSQIQKREENQSYNIESE